MSHRLWPSNQRDWGVNEKRLGGKSGLFLESEEESGCRVKGANANMIMWFKMVLDMCVSLSGQILAVTYCRCVLNRNTKCWHGATEPAAARKKGLQNDLR